jgi:GAF domain-containing protein/ActR/RegA family two-component response regulator
MTDRTGIDSSSDALAGKLRTLIQLIELISSSLDTDEILRQIATAAVRLTGARCVSLWVADEAARIVELRACSDAAIGAGHPAPRLAYGQGVAGWVTLHDEPVKADDLSRTQMVARDWHASHGLQSLYALPVAYQDTVVGVLVLMAEKPFDLEKEEYEILEALIAEAGAAIRNGRLLAESERRRGTAEALAELSRLSSETLDLGTVARRVVESVRTLLGARESSLYRLVPDTGALAALALLDEREQATEPGADVPRGIGVVGLAVRERRPMATSNFADDPRIQHDPAVLGRLDGVANRAVLALPLRLKDRVIGALAVGDRAGRVFLDGEIRLAQAFADQAALVLESAQLFDDAARRRHEVEVLAEVVGQINSSLDLATILSRIVDGACELTGADGAQIALREPGIDGVRVKHRRGMGSAADEALIGLVIESGKGSGGLVLATGRPFRTTNYPEDTRVSHDYLDKARAVGVIAQIVMPIQNGELKGLLYVFNCTARPFTDRDEAALGRLANYAAVAIGNANLLREMERRRREAEVLAEVGRLVSRSLEPDEVGQRIVESVGPLLGSAMATLYRISLETGDFVLLASAGVGSDWHTTLPRGTAAVGLAVRERRPVSTPDVLTDPRISLAPETRAALEHFEHRAILALPLIAGDRVFGALAALGHTGRVFTPHEIRVAQTFVDQAAIALDNARLHSETTRRKWEAEVLAGVGRLVTESLDADEVAGRIADSLRALLGGLSSVLVRVEPVSGALVGRDISADGSGFDVVFPAGTGAIGRAVSTRRPVATTNLLIDPRIALTPELREVLQSRPHRSALALPMIVDDRVVGAIAVRDHEGRAYDSDEVRLAQAFVDQAAMALEKARLFEDSERRRREAEIFAELASQITASLDLDTILENVCDAARELCRADLGIIATRDLPTQTMVVRHWPGAPAPPVERIVAGDGLAGQVLLTGRPFRTDDYAHDPRLRNDPQPLIPVENVEAALAVPIQTDSRVEGLLVVYNRSPRPLTDRDEARLMRLAGQTAIAIRNAQLVEGRRAYQARLEALLVVSHELSRIQPVEELLGAIASACGEVLESDSVGFRLVEGDELVVAGLLGDARETMSTPRIKIGESLSGIVASTGVPLRLEDVTEDPRLIPAHRSAVKRLGYRAFLGVPIKVGERVIGVLSIRTRRLAGFSTGDETIATAFASQAATALENARLFREVQVAAEEVARAQETLLQAQKMDAIGRLAGGVAHDFNNLLTIIHGRCEILLKRFEPGTKPRQDLDLIQRTAHRAAALTKQLLAFSRKQVLQPRVLRLNAVVGESVSMLQRLIGEHIVLTTVPGARRDRVTADPTQLEQVLMNLTINARDAMPQGGRLTIETAEVDLDEAFVREHPGAATGAHVRLSVIDDGMGMSAEVQARIFEPFFTTKDKGRGTGLGLSMVYGIVKQHGGYIGVRSGEGQGTTFDIYLPSAARTDDGRAEAAPQGSGESRASETILLVEDEADVRELAREILEMRGYTVLEAARGDEALRLCQDTPQPIDLLLTDVVMPQMSGPELARRLLALRPGTKVVYMSGYTDDALGHHGVLDPDIILLQKPFTPETLTQHLRQALDGSAKRA